MTEVIELHANGKLLITGEYLVLVGARALALPVRFGQRMTVQQTGGRLIAWESEDSNGVWFKAVFDTETLKIQASGRMAVAGELKKLLSAAKRLTTGFY